MSRQFILASILISSFTSSNIHAQEDVSFLLAGKAPVIDAPSSSIDGRSLRDFNKYFPAVSSAHWSTGSEVSRVKFEKDSIQYIVDYNKKNGKRRSTIKIYGERQLPDPIRKLIKTSFCNYEVVTVSELLYANKHAYFVKLQGTKRLVTARVMDGEIEIVEDYIRS